jgi:hypothetical protein
LLGVSYVGTLGRNLQQTLNINQVPIGSTTQVVPALIGTGTPGCNNLTGLCNVQQVLINQAQPTVFFAPYRGYSNIQMRSPSGNSNYNSLQVSLRHATGYGLMYEVAYTWSHTLDNIVTNGIDDSDVARWYGNSSLNQAQMLIINWTYQLPFYKTSSNAFARQLLGGWQIGGISTFVSGPPVNFTCGINGLSTGIGGNVGCNALAPMVVKKGVLNDPNLGPTPGWFDPAIVGQPTLAQLAANNEPGMFGNMGRNALVGPGRNNWDLALMKNFKLPWFAGESSTLQFRLETFNTFNHPQWQGVNTGCSGQTAPGAPCTGDVMGEVNSAFSPRILQLGLKYIF